MPESGDASTDGIGAVPAHCYRRRSMRPRLLTTLMVLYALFGVAFVVWTSVGLGAPPDSTWALPLPALLMVLAAAANLTLAAGIALRLRATRILALVVHAVPALVAAGLLLLHGLDMRPIAGPDPYLELVMKAGVHALLVVFWSRSAAVTQWFSPT